MTSYDSVNARSHEVRGLAVGGPCDRARLVAPTTWDGLVRDRRRSTRCSTYFIPGRYLWSPTDLTWNWTEDLADVLSGSEAA